MSTLSHATTGQRNNPQPVCACHGHGCCGSGHGCGRVVAAVALAVADNCLPVIPQRSQRRLQNVIITKTLAMDKSCGWPRAVAKDCG